MAWVVGAAASHRAGGTSCASAKKVLSACGTETDVGASLSLKRCGVRVGEVWRGWRHSHRQRQARGEMRESMLWLVREGVCICVRMRATC